MLAVMAGLVNLAMGGAGTGDIGLAFGGAVLLLAGACFARSSPRFHRWLRENRLLGPFLRAWEEQRGLPPGR